MDESNPELHDPTDEESQRELAGANLARMRGDYQAATTQCLSLLHRKPDQMDAHTLLGDIYAEQGDIEQASQWYELALDLNAASVPDQLKLKATRARMKEREAAATAQTLGLPSGQQRLRVYIAGCVVLIILISFAAYLVGQKSVNRYQTASPEVLGKAAPLEANPSVTNVGPNPVETTASDTGTTPNAVPGSTGERTPPLPAASGVDEDRALLAQLSPRVPEVRILSALVDPRSKQTTITFQLKPDDDERKMGAEIAKAALDQNLDTNVVVVRAVRNEHVVYLADVPRSKLIETQSSAWQQENPAADAWVGFVLTKEWTDSKTSAPNTSPTPAPAGP